MFSKIFLILSLSLLSIFSLFAQEKGDPKATEVWEPVPKVVTPGFDTKHPMPPPSDAIIIFNGKDLSQFENKDGKQVEWKLNPAEGSVTVEKGKGDIHTKQKFGDFQLHIEFREPSVVVGESQGRGNSGIFLQERYELQVLDCYNNKTYVNGQTGSIYKQAIPLANVCKKPGEWQTYDVIFTSPHFKEDGSLEKPAYVTVLQNGVLVQNHTELIGSTAYIGKPAYEKHGKGSIKLQDHGNPVSFRNIWIREL